MKRRDFIKSVSLSSGGFFISSGLKARHHERPNILLVLVDQERFPQHDDPITYPNRERLRATSVEFNNHCAVFPLCSPSRASLLTGLYPHQLGIHSNIYHDNEIPSLDPYVPGLGTVFSRQGYKTGYFGKWHLTKNVEKHETLCDYGFRGGISNQKIAIGSDRLVARNAADFIRDNKASHWFLVCSLINPHDICYPNFNPLYPPERDWKVSMPPNVETDHSGHPKAVQLHPENNPLRYGYVNQEWIKNLKYYYDLIAHADQGLGVLLDALEQSGQWKDTIVVYASDHGEMGGSHGLLNKGFIYEECLRVPFLVSAPGRVSGPRAREDLTCHLDLVPTLCALAGVTWPYQLAGRDLAPLDPAGSDHSPDHVFLEGSAGDVKNTIPWRGITTGEWKYALYINGDEQLFYLPEDPLELDDLSADPEAKAEKKELRRKVREWQRETMDPFRGA